MSDSWEYTRGYYPGDWVRPRANTGAWRPMLDMNEVFPGHRSVDRTGAFELYDAPIGVRLAVEEAEKSEPLEFAGGTDRMSNSVRVWQDEEGYHLLYYQSGRVAYARSDDGQRWTCPPLGIIQHEGSKQNNLVTDVGGDMLKAVFEDPTAPPEERFKGMGCQGAVYNADAGEVANEGEEVTDEDVQRWWADQEYLGPDYSGPRLVLKGRVIGWTSPDRIHWTRRDEILANFPMDGGLSVRYDEGSGSFYAYCRVQGVAQEQTEPIGSGAPEAELFHRAIGLTRTRDFFNWPAPQLVLLPNETRTVTVMVPAELLRPASVSDNSDLPVTLLAPLADVELGVGLHEVPVRVRDAYGNEATVQAPPASFEAPWLDSGWPPNHAMGLGWALTTQRRWPSAGALRMPPSSSSRSKGKGATTTSARSSWRGCARWPTSTRHC